MSDLYEIYEEMIDRERSTATTLVLKPVPLFGDPFKITKLWHPIPKPIQSPTNTDGDGI